jgi:hypothetical protein
MAIQRYDWGYDGEIKSDEGEWVQFADVKSLIDALQECEEYFDNHADADHNGERYIPNNAMKMLTTVREALEKAGVTR